MPGKSAITEKTSSPTARPRPVAVTKLRSLSSSTGRKGLSVVALWMANRTRARPATAASIMISLEWNQSLFWPRSRKSWKEASMSESRAKPMASNLSFSPCRRSCRKVETPRKHRMPTGRLM